MKRIAVLVSGTGRHLRNLCRLSRAGELGAEVAFVVASRPDIPALEHARDFDVPAAVLEPDQITDALEEHGIDLVVMAGYLRRWPIPKRFEGRTINIHPSLLPLFGGKGFYGDRVHRAVLESGMRVSGCTVHFVTQNYDEGPIIAQRAVPVHPDDDAQDLARRVFAAEAELLPEVIHHMAKGSGTFDQL